MIQLARARGPGRREGKTRQKVTCHWHWQWALALPVPGAEVLHMQGLLLQGPKGWGSVLPAITSL
jgi:hypothetical protein